MPDLSQIPTPELQAALAKSAPAPAPMTAPDLSHIPTAELQAALGNSSSSSTPVSPGNEQSYLHGVNNEQRFLHNFNVQQHSGPSGNGDAYGDPVIIPAPAPAVISSAAPRPFLPSDFAAATSRGMTPALGAGQPDPLSDVMRQSDATRLAFERNPTPETAAAHKAALTAAYPLVASSGLLKLPDWQAWAAKVKAEGWLNPASSPPPLSAASLPAALSHGAEDTPPQGTPSQGDFLQNAGPSLLKFGQGLLSLPSVAGQALLSEGRGVGALAEKTGDAAMYGLNSLLGNKDAAAGYYRAADRAEAREKTAAAPILSIASGMTPTLQDLATVAGNYAGGQPGEARRVLKSIPVNTWKAFNADPVQTLANAAVVFGAGGSALGKAGELADAAGAARLGAGLSKAGQMSHYVAGGGPVGTLVSKGVSAAAGAALGRLPLGRVPAPENVPAENVPAENVPAENVPAESISPSVPEPVDIHPTQPVGPNNTARAADGTFVSPESVPAPASPAPAGPMPGLHPDALASLGGDEADILARRQAAAPAPAASGPPEAIPAPTVQGGDVQGGLSAPAVNSAPALTAPGVRPVPGLSVDTPSVKSLPLDRAGNPPAFTPPKGNVAETPPHLGEAYAAGDKVFFQPKSKDGDYAGGQAAQVQSVVPLADGTSDLHVQASDYNGTRNYVVNSSEPRLRMIAPAPETPAAPSAPPSAAAKRLPNANPALPTTPIKVTQTAGAMFGSDSAPFQVSYIDRYFPSREEANAAADFLRTTKDPEVLKTISEGEFADKHLPVAAAPQPAAVNLSEDVLPDGAGTPVQRARFNELAQTQSAGQKAMAAALKEQQSAGRFLRRPDLQANPAKMTAARARAGAADEAVSQTLEAVKSVNADLLQSADEIHPSLKTRVGGQISRREEVHPLGFVPSVSKAEVAEPQSTLVPAEIAPTPAERIATETHITSGTGATFTPTKNDMKPLPGSAADPYAVGTRHQITRMQKQGLSEVVTKPVLEITGEGQRVGDDVMYSAKDAATGRKGTVSQSVLSAGRPVRTFSADEAAAKFRRIQESSAAPGAKVDPKTGMTPAQKSYLQKALDAYVHTPEAHDNNASAHTIDVPGDGRYTVAGAAQANALHVNLTNKGLLFHGVGRDVDPPIDLQALYKHKPEEGFAGNGTNPGNSSRYIGEYDNPGLPTITVAPKDRAAVLAKYASDEPFPEVQAADQTPDTTDRLEQVAQAAKSRITARNKGRALSGVDPADLADMTVYGAAKLAKGVVNAAEWGRQMMQVFGEGIRPHLDALYQAAKDHLDAANHAAHAGQDIAAARQAHLQSLDAEKILATPQVTPQVTPQAAAEPGGASSLPKSPKPEYAGSLNLDRMGLTEAAKERVRAAADRLGAGEVLPRDVASQAAKDLNLTPSMLAGLKPGEVPTGVHPVIFDKAVRDLHAATEEHAAQVLKDTQGDNSPEAKDKRDKAQADADALFAHDNARSRIAGQSLSARNMIASAQDAALETAQVKQKALANTAALTQPESAPGPALRVSTKSPKSAGYGKSNTLVTSTAKDEALARIRASAGRVNSGIDPALIKDAVLVGAYHVEAGLRAFGPWAAQMKQDVPGMTAAQEQQVYAASRAQHAAGVTTRLKQTGNLVLADALAARGLGRQGASDFIDALANHPQHPDLLPKILSGNTLSPAERGAVNAAYRAAAPAKSTPAPTPQSLAQIRQITQEFAKQNAAARLAKLKAAKGTTIPDPLMQTLKGRLGKTNAPEFLRRLNTDPATAGTETKLRAGQELTDKEARAAAGHLNDLKLSKTPAPASDVSKTLTQAVRDAKAGRLGFDTAKDVVWEELKDAVEPGKLGAVRQALAGIGDNDFKVLGNIYNHFNPTNLPEKIKTVQQASLLSGPRTLGAIAAAHTLGAGFEDAAVRPIAAALGGGTVQGVNPAASVSAIRAAGRALPEGLRTIREGTTAAALRGIAPSYRMDDLPGGHLHGEPVQNPLVRLPGRVHAALYQTIGEGLMERGVQEFSALKARKQGGLPAQYRGDADVIAQAKQYAQEQLFQNKNRAASAITHGAAAAGPVGKVAINTVLPFRNVPLNLAGRGVEYMGGGVPMAASRAIGAKLTGKDYFSGKPVVPPGASAADASAAQDAFRRALAFQAARGIAGPALGLSAGYGLASAGVLNPPNEKRYENGSLNIGRNKYDIGRLQPVSTPLLEGGELANALHHKPSSALAPFADNPYSQAAETLSNIQEGFSGKPHALQQVIGGFVGELSPTLLAQIASATDPSGSIRKKNTAWDYLMNRVPGLRERLHATSHPQSSNYAATGPLSLLSPVSVSPRGRK